MSCKDSLLAFLILLPSLLLGTHTATPPEKKSAPDHLMVGVGIFNVDKGHRRFVTQLEYRWDVHCYHIRPLVGFFLTTDQSLYFCGGAGLDIFLGKRVVLTPSFAPGIYLHARGKNLGFPLNFRSALELAYVLPTQGRIGAQFNHISNASLSKKNPGADSLIFYYALPLPHKGSTSKKKGT